MRKQTPYQMDFESERWRALAAFAEARSWRREVRILPAQSPFVQLPEADMIRPSAYFQAKFACPVKAPTPLTVPWLTYR